MEPQTAARYRLLDELRGLDLISMMLYHGMWDVVFLFGVAQKWYTGRPGFVWQQSICWVFLLLSGFCLPMNGFWNLPGGRLALPQALYASWPTAYLGFMPKSFFSTDYFPLLPWLFLFWAGYFLHHLVGRGRLAPLRRSVCPPLGWMGRHSLVLYLLHQPVILGVLTVAFRLVRAG